MSEKENKYEPIRGDMYIGSKDAILVRSSSSEGMQLDRVEQKLDKLLALVEGKELSVIVDGKAFSDYLTSHFEKEIIENSRKISREIDARLQGNL